MQELKSLTAREKQVLNFVNRFFRENGCAPSLKEIASELKTSSLSTAQYLIEQLKEKGRLTKERGRNRGITPVHNPHTLSLLGFIAAGEPIEPIENPKDISVPENINIDSRYPHYALKVKGDSMIDMGIIDGDIVLIKHQLFADSGDIIVAITENGATLKTYKNKDNKITLEPRNPDYKIIHPRQLEIRGKFIGLIRQES